MDTKKLDRWAELLLDTGKRNNLVHFRDTKTSTAEILIPSAEDLFERIDGSMVFEVFDPKITEGDEETDDGNAAAYLPDSEAALTEREAYRNLYSSKIRRQNQLLLYNSAPSPIPAVKNIDKKAKEFIEETGVNVAYMAFGFIHWTESESSGSVFRAPVLLVPVQLERDSLITPYHIRSTEDDIVVNPTFSYKLDAEYGIKLPEYDDESLDEYLEKVRELVGRLHWTVTADCRIGIFSFLKINMYRDLKDNASVILGNPNVRRLLGEPVETEVIPENGGEPPVDPLVGLHCVVDADSSQIEAIEMARSGQSFVLQGPPGTGKSQTITNMIAECLSEGRKVLFVSEKLAALNVVYDKLRQAGLAEFCLELHSHKANKKDVIADICQTLRAGRSAVSSKADAEIAIKVRARQQLDAYAEELHQQRPVIGKSLYQLYESYSALRDIPEVEWSLPGLESKGSAFLTETTALLEQYVDYIPSVGYDYRRNPWYGFIGQDISYQAKTGLKADLAGMVRCLDELIPLTEEITSRYQAPCGSLAEARAWHDVLTIASDSRWITPALLRKDLFLRADEALGRMRALSGEILAGQADLETAYDQDIYKLDGTEYHKKLTKQFGGFFSRLFSSEYRQIMSALRLCRKDGSRLSYREAVDVTERLSACQQRLEEYAQTEMSARSSFGAAYAGIHTDWSYAAAQMETLRSAYAIGLSFGNLTDLRELSSESRTFAELAEKLRACFALCGGGAPERIADSFDRQILDIEAASCSLVRARCERCLGAMDMLENWCHFRSLLLKLTEQDVVSFLDEVIRRQTAPEFIVKAFQKQFYFQWIDSILSASPVLAAFNRISQDRAVDTFARKDIEQFEISKAQIRAELSADRPSLDMISSGSALAVLLREGEKKRKQKSIRTLLTETGELVQRIKPCFLMSPLSVSTFLTADSVHFDVVIFDEASQIFPQDAIGAIYRADQMIVVGDSKQMPPSNFFNAMIENEDDDEETGDVTDFESILDLCAASMRQLRLRWHYRSRFEQLISFSNKNFYENDLVTFPSARADAKGVGVDYFHADGIFDRRSHTNRKEAEYIVDLIYQNIEKYPNRSLGVVAFSVAQQDLIDKLLSRRRQATPEKEFFFKRDVQEPFFIKNLETVQGDERDTIIFSIAYGIDAQGRLLHNFGPLNRIGGERRLNVAVTRAKYNVQLVSSMHCADIDLKRTASAGARLLREYLDFAENGIVALERTMSVNPYDTYDSDFEAEVCEFLRSKGFSVDTQVGCSGFRIDLGLKRSDSSDYVLAIECDGAAYHSSKNARDRDRLRQEILERMGWKFYRVWSTDWFRNRALEQMRLLKAAEEAVCHPQQEDLAAGGTKNSEDEVPAGSYEEAVEVIPFEFPRYQAADIEKLSQKYFPHDFKGMIRAILEIEAPLSEELLLKRIAWCFGREKVTSVVQRAYEERMYGCERRGILRRDGFLYLDEMKEIGFRGPGDITRDIRQIAPEELAAGMLEVLRQNVSADKNGLYRSLALQCGFSRVGKAAGEWFDHALGFMGDLAEIDGDKIMIK